MQRAGAQQAPQADMQRALQRVQPVRELAKTDKQQEKPLEKNPTLCWICQKKPIDAVLLPGGKACTCFECGEVLMKNEKEQNQCPITRTVVISVARCRFIEHGDGSREVVYDL